MAESAAVSGNPDVDHLAQTAEVAGICVPEIVLPRDRNVVLRDFRFHYLDWGGAGAEPNGAPIVFLHGGGLTAHTWDVVCLALRAEYRSYALDLRGHGDSEWSPTLDYGLDAQVEDLEAFVDHVGCKRLFVVGQSLGGAIGLRFSARHGHLLAGLVLIDVGPFLPGPTGFRRIVEFSLAREEFDSIEEAVEYAVRFNPRRDPSLLRYSLERNLRQLPDGRWTWKRDHRHLSPDYFAGLLDEVRGQVDEARDIACPVLVVRGEESEVFSEENASRLASLVPDGRHVTVADAGHNIQGDNPAGLIRALQPFLREHSAR